MLNVKPVADEDGMCACVFKREGEESEENKHYEKESASREIDKDKNRGG